MGQRGGKVAHDPARAWSGRAQGSHCDLQRLSQEVPGARPAPRDGERRAFAPILGASAGVRSERHHREESLAVLGWSFLHVSGEFLDKVSHLVWTLHQRLGFRAATARTRKPIRPGTFTTQPHAPEQPELRQLASDPVIMTLQPPVRSHSQLNVVPPTPGPPPALRSMTPLRPFFTNS
jgi:hypothetical protein